MNDSTVSEPKVYKSQVAAEKFVELYLASDDEFEEMRSKGEAPEG
jgi:hypothetical protein